MLKSVRRARRARKQPTPPSIKLPPEATFLVLQRPPAEGEHQAGALLVLGNGSTVPLKSVVATEADAIQAVMQLRQEAAAEIDRLIDLLDATQGDADREPQGDEEPSIGAQERPGRGWPYPSLASDEAEDDDESEPSLGATETLRQTAWGCGGRKDLEDEHDGREPDVDGEPSLCAADSEGRPIGDDQDLERDTEDELEPSLGSPFRIDQTKWGQSARSDREVDGGDECEMEASHEG